VKELVIKMTVMCPILVTYLFIRSTVECSEGKCYKHSDVLLLFASRIFELSISSKF